jgi:hypothetical protein
MPVAAFAASLPARVLNALMSVCSGTICVACYLQGLQAIARLRAAVLVQHSLGVGWEYLCRHAQHVNDCGSGREGDWAPEHIQMGG